MTKIYEDQKADEEKVAKVQLLAKRFLLRNRYKWMQQPKTESGLKCYFLEFLVGKCKKLDDGKYYLFMVHTVTTGTGKKKHVKLVFRAKEVNKRLTLEYTHKLPVYTSNQDSLTKVAEFMIEYCLCLNEKYELYMDQDLYAGHKEELKNVQKIDLIDSVTSANSLYVPAMWKQVHAVMMLQRAFKRHKASKEKSKTNFMRKVVYKTYMRKARILYMIKIVEMG